MTASEGQGPLAGRTVIELGGIGPGPYCGQLLADLGAKLILVQRPGRPGLAVENRGKHSIILDLQKPGAASVVLRLAETADALIEGYRPGVAERLGVGPQACQARNPALVYGRMTGWGQSGPMAPRAGHDINYIGLTGALHAMGRPGEPPPAPLNLVGDYGGGSLFLALGVVAAMLRAQTTGEGDVVDAAIVDGAGSMMGVVHSLDAVGQWTPARGANLLDGARPYYRCYAAADARYMAVGCLEPQFFAVMLDRLGIDPEAFGGQEDADCWPQQHRLLETVFAGRTRDQWTAIFEGSDACVTPVLDYVEASRHPHNVARRSHLPLGDVTHPHAAPRFSGHPWQAPPSRPAGADSVALLRAAGYEPQEIDRLVAEGTVGAYAA